MEVGLVKSVDIDNEMQQAYLDYAMSVIVARALPDARDGLKPVHRRILYAMYDMGLRTDSAYKKSARIVGEVLGKYHPHGDQSVYEAMARFAQDFSMRYLLVEGQGNFGSVDGDPPAAMRYTEARLTSPAMEMLGDIQKNTVNFTPNFDGTLVEPDVLPAAIPNLLVNGATGIAVGMSTSIPPHNLNEVVSALMYILENWEKLDDISLDDLMHFIKGPDFPTGGIIVQNGNDEEGLTSAYGTGRGRVTVQARAHIEEISRGRNRIIVTELPYMTNKSALIERIAELVREERLDGIADLRDESDRQGLRIMIELNKAADPETVLANLFKHTPMRSTFGIIMLALVDGEPRTLSLKQALRVYLDHRLEVVKRRGEFDLERARQRAHILEGLRVALKNLDEVIELIRKAPDVETARSRLMKRFKLSEIQAQAILDMPLRRLAALERKKIEEEYKEVTALIKDLESLLRSPKRMRQVVSEELSKVNDAYGDRRRTQILRSNGNGPVLLNDLTPTRTVWVTVTTDGLISRSLDDALPPSSGKAVPKHAIQVNTRDTLFLISELGEAAGLPVHALPETADPAAGVPFHRVSALGEHDKLAAIFTLKPKEERQEGDFVFTATIGGMVKKTAVSELPGPTGHTFTLMKVNEGDRFGWVRLTNGIAEILLATAAGMAIRFSEEDVRPMGLVAAGVGGIKLAANDYLVGVDSIYPGGDILLVATDGKAKRVPENGFPKQGRNGQGVAAWKLVKGAALAAMASFPKFKTRSSMPKVVLFLEKLAPKSLHLDEVIAASRAAAGKPAVEVKDNDKVMGMLVLAGDGGAKEGTKDGKDGGSDGPGEVKKTRTRTAAVKKRDDPGQAVPKASRSTKAKSSESFLKPIPTPALDGKPAPKAAKKPAQSPKPSTEKSTPNKESKAAQTAAKKPAAKKAAPTAGDSGKPATVRKVPAKGTEKPGQVVMAVGTPDTTKTRAKTKPIKDEGQTSKKTTPKKPSKKTTPVKPAAGKKTPLAKKLPEKPASKPSRSKKAGG